MRLTGWGNNLHYDSNIAFPHMPSEIIDLIANRENSDCIARGLGRSYGDSSLAKNVFSSKYLDSFIDFDDDSGTITCFAGITLAEIASIFVPKGWFLQVTPGTKFVTVGGAIASDVHGKNHHVNGCFSEHLISFKIVTVSHGLIECTREKNFDLFYATCGGMGLTGFILEATFRLKRIGSAFIKETNLKTSSLQETMELFSSKEDSEYSVAWIDCIASGAKLGRSIISLGEHCNEGDFSVSHNKPYNVPMYMPDFVLNSYSIQLFNSIYYNRQKTSINKRRLHYDSYFYPLDKITNWNRMYGKKGFIQYQLVLPYSSGFQGMKTIMELISKSKLGSFLAVLKLFGKSNENYLSFPIPGFTLALDFRINKVLFPVLTELDSIVLDYGGRLYLAKDSRMPEMVFKRSYSKWREFSKIREKYGANKVFNSLQSKRLGL